MFFLKICNKNILHWVVYLYNKITNQKKHFQSIKFKFKIKRYLCSFVRSFFSATIRVQWLKSANLCPDMCSRFPTQRDDKSRTAKRCIRHHKNDNNNDGQRKYNEWLFMYTYIRTTRDCTEAGQTSVHPW